MIKVYQFQLTDAEINAINGGVENERSKAYFARSFDRTFKAEYFEHYTHVATLNTSDMEEAFDLMNRWERNELVEKHMRCSSMSVGDILEMEDGKRYRCASFGFTALEDY